MKTRTFLALLSAACCSLPLAAPAAAFPKGSPPFITSYAALKAQQKATGKPAILVFSATWCPSCQIMKKSIYPGAAVKPYHDQFLWAYLDVDDPANADAASKYGVSALPHITFLNTAGKPAGYLVTVSESPEAFAAVLRKVFPQVNSGKK